MTPAELDAIEARHGTLMDFSAPIGTQWQLATNDIPALVAEVRRLQGAIKAWADELREFASDEGIAATLEAREGFTSATDALLRIGWTLPNPTP